MCVSKQVASPHHLPSCLPGDLLPLTKPLVINLPKRGRTSCECGIGCIGTTALLLGSSRPSLAKHEWEVGSLGLLEI